MSKDANVSNWCIPIQCLLDSTGLVVKSENIDSGMRYIIHSKDEEPMYTVTVIRTNLGEEDDKDVAFWKTRFLYSTRVVKEGLQIDAKAFDKIHAIMESPVRTDLYVGEIKTRPDRQYFSFEIGINETMFGIDEDLPVYWVFEDRKKHINMIYQFMGVILGLEGSLQAELPCFQGKWKSVPAPVVPVINAEPHKGRKKRSHAATEKDETHPLPRGFVEVQGMAGPSYSVPISGFVDLVDDEEKEESSARPAPDGKSSPDILVDISED
jgi:hypothetical protein